MQQQIEKRQPLQVIESFHMPAEMEDYIFSIPEFEITEFE